MGPTSAGARRLDRGVILVLYYARYAPLRASSADHLAAFRRYSGQRCIYINLAVRRIPRWVRRLNVRLVVLHTLLFAARWDGPMFAGVRRRLGPVRGLDCPRIAIPQDEYIFTDRVADILRELRVSHVLTCAPESELRTIYGDLVDAGVEFTRVLPGYLDPATVARIEGLAAGREQDQSRPIDIGYRAYDPEFSLGRHAQLKSAVGRAVAGPATELGLRTDVSLRPEDTIRGDDWYRFLLNCRWVIGAEGGASLLDRDGTFLERSRRFQEAHPEADFEAAEAACFPGQDGSIRYFSVSPRHLEACVTRTGQLLVAGDYNGILQPNVHYLPIHADLADLSDVLARAGDEGLRKRLAERAYRDIVASRAFEYPAFVRIALRSMAPTASAPGLLRRGLIAWEAGLDRPSWLLVRGAQAIRGLGRWILDRAGLLDAAKRRRSPEERSPRSGRPA